MGNMDSLRDWGHARDYVEMQWLMLQQGEARDYVIATGEQSSVREFIAKSAARLGITLTFEGQGLNEIGRVSATNSALADEQLAVKPGDIMVRVDPRYYRPAEVESLLGDPALAREQLGWKPSTTLDEMISEMVAHDLTAARKNRLLQREGYEVSDARE